MNNTSSTKYMAAWKWCKRNLFSSPVNVVITLILIFLMSLIFYKLIEWAFINATWVGDSKQSCLVEGTNMRTGACWPFIQSKILFFLFGFYPIPWMWRPALYLLIVFTGTVFLFSSKLQQHRNKIYMGLFVLVPLLTFVLLRGWGSFAVSADNWGGLLLSVTLSVFGILFSFPIGIILALMRTGRFKPIKIFSVCVIEFFRGIPLVTILFMSAVVVPLFFPSEITLSKFLRLTVGMIIFESVYLAEVIRGGLQAIPKGQIEAAQSLGISWGSYTYFVVLPQAIRVSLANITSISIAFVKDTSLVLIVGWFDLLGIVKPLSSDSQWLGMESEGYLFVGVMFWGLCVFVSRIGAKLEKAESSFMNTKKL